MIRFLEARAIAGLEIATPQSYCRVIEFDGAVGSIQVTHAPEDSSLHVTVRFPRLKVLPSIIARIRRQFDLGAEPIAIAAALSGDPILAPLVLARPGLRVPGGWDGFEIAVRAVLGQQITVKAATKLAARIVSMLGRQIAEPCGVAGLTHLFPRPEQFSAKELIGMGMPKTRAMTLVGIAQAMLADGHLFEPRRDLDEAVVRLRDLAGIGEWTAQYIALRALGESDAFLADDVALQRRCSTNGRRPTAQQLLAHAQRWRPWRAYAMLHLWMADADSINASSNKEIYDALTA